jgi:hypothetical protein
VKSGYPGSRTSQENISGDGNIQQQVAGIWNLYGKTGKGCSGNVRFFYSHQKHKLLFDCFLHDSRFFTVDKTG